MSCLLAVSASAGFAQADLAQQPAGPPPAHVPLIEGQAYIDREGRSDPAVPNVPLLDGDRLRTADGRLEVNLPDGSMLHADRDTTFGVLATDLLRLLRGRVYVVVRGARDPQRVARYQIDAPVASVPTGGPGEFRVWAAETARGLAILEAVASPQRLSDDPDRARHVLDLVPSVPSLIWGRDELGTGEMWNSNSVVSWLLARSGVPAEAIRPPPRGRAPGWQAGMGAARRGGSSSRREPG